MLTESEARDLLALAAATVEVSPVTTLPDVPPRRRWPVLAAAAAVLAVVGVGAALGLRSGDDVPAGVEAVPRVDFQGRPDVLGEDQLPSVFGYSGEDARAMLTDHGLSPTLRHEFVACNQPGGRALRTVPAVGTHFEPGDTVVLIVGRTRHAPCPMNADAIRAWQLIDFANGRGPAPDFAEEVWVAANDDSQVITGAAATDPAIWVDGSPLGVLRQQSSEVEEATGYTFQTPTLVTYASTDSPHCHGLDLSGVPRSGFGFGISIEFLADGISLRCTVVDVFLAAGQISAISLRTNQVPLETTAPGTVPDLIGMTADEARAALTDQGLVAEVVPPPGTKLCLRELPAIVGNQSHPSGTELAPGSVVTVALRWVSCEESPDSTGPEAAVRAQTTTAFLEFAYGGKVRPHIGTSLDLYLGNQLARTLDAAEARDPANWKVCIPPGYAGQTCPFSALTTIDRWDGQLSQVAPPPRLLCAHPGDLPAALADDPRTIVIVPAHPTSCGEGGQWAVQLWFDDASNLVAVNLTLGEP